MMSASFENLGVLRFITAGSVDDGKSTLIGRLLYDSQAVLSDQLYALTNAKNKRVSSEEIDFSLLTDGLEAEREQGITIDVAYRYFATAKRKFIIADTPGHEQYTRNMVTGASTADAAVILIDGTRVKEKQGRLELLAQTKRHSAIVKLLGLKHVIVAVNKLDLLNYDQNLFNSICEAYRLLANQLGLKQVIFVPVSALKGDNIVYKSDRMPWYKGGALLEVLESIQLLEAEQSELRFPVQYVLRQDGALADDFRGYMGRIEAGQIHVGDQLSVLPSSAIGTVTEIIGPAGLIQQAKAGQCVTIRFNEDLDISRGNMLVSKESQKQLSKKIIADMCWLDSEPMSSQRKYILKHTTASVFTRIDRVETVLDMQTLSHGVGQAELKMNDIGVVHLTVQNPIACDAYIDNPKTGSFILIDEASHHTVAAGMIR